MQSIDFPQMNVVIGDNQPEYIPLKAFVDFNDPTSPAIMCFELSEEEIIDIVRTKKIWYKQLTFNQPFQPINFSTKDPFIPNTEADGQVSEAGS